VFDGTTGDFDTWQNQLRLLKRTYRLDDEHARVLVRMRLRGKALEWLHSKAELVELSVEDLLNELKVMFNHRPSKIMLRKKFEERVWKKGESFTDYMHQKVILGNRVPIEEDELIEYIIDSIPERALRDQARISGLQTRASLMASFERVTLWDKKNTGTKSGEEKSQFRPKADKNSEGTRSEQKKRNCFNCGLSDHLGKDCPTKEGG